jgi:hypothetical protein
VTDAEVVALEERFQAGVRDRDLAVLEELLAPEFTLTTGRAAAPVRMRAEYLELTARSYRIDEFAFEELDVVGLGPSAALVRARYRQRGSMDGADRTGVFLLTDVWADRGGQPQLVARHSSALA